MNGTLTVTGASFDRAGLETVNGHISSRASSGRARRSTWRPSAARWSCSCRRDGRRLHVSTFSGDIRNDWGRPPDGHRWTREKELTFTTGAGGATVDIETLSGHVILRKR